MLGEGKWMNWDLTRISGPILETLVLVFGKGPFVAFEFRISREDQPASLIVCTEQGPRLFSAELFT